MLLIFLLRLTQMIFLMIWCQDWLNFYQNQYTHLCIKTWKLMRRMQVIKGTIFCWVRYRRRKCYNIYVIFQTRGFFFPTSYFSPERVPGVVKIVSHILKSLFYQKLVKIVSLDKRQSHAGYTFSSCLVITDSKLT